MLFPLKKDILTSFQGAASLNNTIEYTISRDFFLDYLYLRIPITISGLTSTVPVFTAAGLAAVVKRIQLSINDGNRNANQHDVSGYGALRRAARLVGNLDPQTINCLGPVLNDIGAFITAVSGAGSVFNQTYLLTIPIFFGPPQISDPIKSAFYLPLPRYNTDPVLKVQFGALTDIFTTASTAAIALGTPWVSIGKRFVTNVQSPTIDTEVKEQTFAIPSSNPSFPMNLDVPGSYASAHLFLSDPTVGSGNVQPKSGLVVDGSAPWSVQVLSNVVRRFALSDISIDEALSMGNDNWGQSVNTSSTSSATSLLIPYFPQNYALDFLHDGIGMEVGELGSLADTNVLAGSGSLFQILANVNGATNVNVTQERYFGDLSPLKLALGSVLG